MSRLEVKMPGAAQAVVEQLYRNMERRIAASPPGLCPVDMALNFLNLCQAQTCGKCVPCRIGLAQLSNMIREVLEGEPQLKILDRIEATAQVIVDTADCAIGIDAANLVLMGLKGFRDDYEEHILHHRCLGTLKNPVPCVALCPAGVDIPGYISLVNEGRCADAVRLIRKDNPFPTACAYICEHPCEARCRRNMVDDALNIRGLKRYAVDHAGDVPQPKKAPASGKSVAIVGGGPGGLSAAYYLALMGHKVTVYEQQSKLGGMMRYGIPSYRFPREKLDAEIASILSLGIEVHTGVKVGQDVTFDQLKKEHDCVYISIGAHTDKKTGIEGEDGRLRGGRRESAAAGPAEERRGRKRPCDGPVDPAPDHRRGGQGGPSPAQHRLRGASAHSGKYRHRGHRPGQRVPGSGGERHQDPAGRQCGRQHQHPDPRYGGRVRRRRLRHRPRHRHPGHCRRQSGGCQYRRLSGLQP